MTNPTPNKRHVEILAEEAAKDPQNEHFLSESGGDFANALLRLPAMQFILSGRSILSAMQRVEEEKDVIIATLRSENERLRVLLEPYKCRQCNGDGWYVGHANTPHTNGECEGDCPIQVQCDECRAEGYITCGLEKGGEDE